MNNSIQRFDFKGASLRALTNMSGEPWFVLKDCMSILDLGNPTETVKMFDDDEFSTTEVIDSISRVRQGHMVMVSSRSHGIHKDGTPFAYPPTPKLTRKGLALIHQRLSEQSFERVLDAEVAA